MPAVPDPNRLRTTLNQDGLNAFGVADGDAWQAVLPGCRSVLVFASGGPVLFDRFTSWLAEDSGRLAAHSHPLDAFVRLRIRAADPRGYAGTAGRRWVVCAADGLPLDFRRLAVDAGLGWLSRTGLLLHPEHGLWLGIRAALFTTEPVQGTGPLPGSGPCSGCSAPCVPACPGGAMTASATRENPSVWDWDACASFRRDEPCRIRCDVRNACPEGAASRYPTLAQHYHNDHAGSGRTALAAALGVAPGAGPGPGWGVQR